MRKIYWTGLALGVTLLLAQGRTQAGDTILLGGAASAPTQTLTYDGNAQTHLVLGHWHRRGWGRGWGGYYGGGWGGYYGGGWGGGWGYPSYGYGYGSYYPSYGYGGWGGGYYPSYGYGYGGYSPYSTGYGWGGGYYPSYGYGYGGYGYPCYGGYYYMSGRSEVGAAMPPATTLAIPPQQPSNGTYNYDGGPAMPVPIPGAGVDPTSKPAVPAQPKGALLVSLPRQTTGFVSAVVTPTARVAQPAAVRNSPYIYRAYGEN